MISDMIDERVELTATPERSNVETGTFSSDFAPNYLGVLKPSDDGKTMVVDSEKVDVYVNAVLGTSNDLGKPVSKGHGFW